MNAFALSALALSSLNTPPDNHTARDWTLLDRDIESLSSSLRAADGQGATVSAWIKTAYRANSDKFVDLNGNSVQDPGENELGGVELQGARINFSGKVGAFDLKASVDGAAGPVTTKDFYARTHLTDHISMQVGNFKSPFLYAGVAADEKEIFFDRSTQGALWAGRELGLQLDGQHGIFGWYAAAQNGGDGAGDEWLLIGKGALAVIGDLVPMKQTGGFGVDSPLRLQAAVGFASDTNALVGDADAVVGELVLIQGPLFVLADVIDYGDGFIAGNGIGSGNASKAAAANLADTSPVTATVGFMVTPQDELAFRYEDWDDAADTKLYWAGYTRYFEGHPAKLQANWIHSDDDVMETDEIVVGLVVNI